MPDEPTESPADDTDEAEDHSGDSINPSGVVRPATVDGLPSGYEFGVTRFADVVLKSAMPDRFADLIASLSAFNIDLLELRQGGGGRTVFVKRFDDSLAARADADGATVWGKRNITVEHRLGLDGQSQPVSRTRGHEIDMFGQASADAVFPGVAVEMEWNNKDPFYDRDLLNFQALHREGAIVAGVIVTRGPKLQRLIGPIVRSKDGGLKFGQSTTHWDKLIARVNLGGGGECPLLIVGIEPDRIAGVEAVEAVRVKLTEAAHFKSTWRDSYSKWADAAPIHKGMVDAARDLLPPLATVEGDQD